MYNIVNNKPISLLKSILISIIIGALAILLFFINVRKVENFPVVSSPVVTASTTIKNSIEFEKMVGIISRDGKLSMTLARSYADWIHDAAFQHNVSPILVLSVMSIESRFRATAVSPSGPIGLLQIAHTWHKKKSSRADLFKPKNNIYVGTRILAEYSLKDSKHSDQRTLIRYYGGDRSTSLVYAQKVIDRKHKYEKEILTDFYIKTI